MDYNKKFTLHALADDLEKKVIDKMAAVVILQSYLDHRGGKK